jgi:hypothetical protein
MSIAMERPVSREIETCMENCLDCSRACRETMSYCLLKGGRHAELEHIKLLVDCAAICTLAVEFMMRGSAGHGLVCGACAKICGDCADDCGMMEDDSRMQSCADICRRCADSCAAMAH